MKIMPTTYFMVLLILAIVVHFALPIIKIIIFPWNIIGILLILFGIILNLWADQIFKKGNTTVKPHLMPDLLVTSGPFCISRHPMYLGMAAILLGTAVLLGSIITFIFPVIFIILMEAIFIPTEERNLGKQFGEKYKEYKNKARRWI